MKIIRIASIFFIIFSILFINTVSAQILNGSFESGPDPGTWKRVPPGSGPDNWIVESGGSIDYIGNLWVANDGSRSVDLNGNLDGLCILSQTFSTIPGSEYTIEFA